MASGFTTHFATLNAESTSGSAEQNGARKKENNMIREWIGIGLGGMAGAVARHGLTQLFSLIGPAWLPIATLTVNVGGCFAIGALAQWSLQQELPKEWWVVGLRVGLLGGLTTFSTFGLDIVRLWNENQRSASTGLLLGHLVLGVTAVAAGLMVAKQPAE